MILTGRCHNDEIIMVYKELQPNNWEGEMIIIRITIEVKSLTLVEVQAQNLNAVWLIYQYLSKINLIARNVLKTAKQTAFVTITKTP